MWPCNALTVEVASGPRSISTSQVLSSSWITDYRNGGRGVTSPVFKEGFKEIALGPVSLGKRGRLVDRIKESSN
jgi:hypothetical protein